MKHLRTRLLTSLFFVPAFLLAQSAAVTDLTWNGGNMVEDCNSDPQVVAMKSWGDKLYTVWTADGTVKVVRYLSNGIQDTAWDGDGVKEFNYLPNNCHFYSMDVDGNGRVYLLFHTGGNWYFWRLNTDGSQDNTFNAEAAPAGNMLRSIRVLPDGRIIGCGMHYDAGTGDEDCILVRYLADGSLDNSFGAGGIVVTSGVNKTDEGEYYTGIEYLSNGNLLAKGIHWIEYSQSNEDLNFIGLYTADGQLITFQYVYPQWAQISTLPLSGGKFLIQSSLSLQRFSPMGVPDSSFGIRSVVERGSNDILFTDAALLQDGKIFAVGRKEIQGVDFPAIFKFTADGLPDTGFGTNGEALLDTTWQHGQLTHALIQGDGKLLAAGIHYRDYPGPNYYRCLYVGRFWSGFTVDFIPPQATDFSVSAYPNPVQGHRIRLRMESPVATTVTLTMHDLAGRQLMFPVSFPVHMGKNADYPLSLPEGLARGMYFVQVQAEEMQQTVRIVVE